MDERKILHNAQKLRFHYVEDLAALRRLEQRLAETGRSEGLITYSDLVKHIPFNLPSLRNGQPIELGIPDWPDLHRAILGGCLGQISCDTPAGQVLGQRSGRQQNHLGTDRWVLRPA